MANEWHLMSLVVHEILMISKCFVTIFQTFNLEEKNVELGICQIVSYG
jgi:hypothetical protein